MQEKAGEGDNSKDKAVLAAIGAANVDFLKKNLPLIKDIQTVR